MLFEIKCFLDSNDNKLLYLLPLLKDLVRYLFYTQKKIIIMEPPVSRKASLLFVFKVMLISNVLFSRKNSNENKFLYLLLLIENQLYHILNKMVETNITNITSINNEDFFQPLFHNHSTSRTVFLLSVLILLPAQVICLHSAIW